VAAPILRVRKARWSVRLSPGRVCH
jgi:hypothetical protein